MRMNRGLNLEKIVAQHTTLLCVLKLFECTTLLGLVLLSSQVNHYCTQIFCDEPRSLRVCVIRKNIQQKGRLVSSWINNCIDVKKHELGDYTFLGCGR